MPSPLLRVVSAGSNAHGQLANESFDDSYTFQPCVFALDDQAGPIQQVPGDHIVSIACGANHTLLLLELTQHHGSLRQLWGSGDGRKGQLGPKVYGDDHQNRCCSVFQRLDQSILDAANVNEESHVIHAIAASWESSFIVLRRKHKVPSRDIVLAIGNNDHGDLGVGLTPTELKYSQRPRWVALEELFDKSYPNILSGFHVTTLTAGPHHVVATLQLFLKGGEKQVVVGWGACRHGQLGPNLSHLKTRPEYHKATRINSLTCFPGILPLYDKPSDNPDPVVSIALGSHHTVLLHHSGRITCFGSNRKGQLDGLQEKAAPSGVYCTWNGTYITFEGSSGKDLPDSEILEWQIQATGSRDKGQIGDALRDSSHPGVVYFPFKSSTRRLIGIACGSEHILALLAGLDEGVEEDTEVWGWGWNEHGNLGLGHTADAHVPVVVSAGLSELDRPVIRHVLGVWAGCGTSWIVERR